MQRQLTNPMAALQGSSKLGLLLALALAIATAVVIYAVLQKNEKDSEARVVASGNVVTVVAARETIPAGTRIEPGMLELKPFAEDSLIAGTATNLTQAVGQIARIPILAGEPVIAGKLTSEAVLGDGLSYVIPTGRRALGVHVDKVIGAGGLIRPGDHVDVFAVLPTQVTDPVTGKVSSNGDRPVTVAQNIEVLAVEQELLRVAPGQGNEERTEETGGVLPDQAAPQPAGSVVTLAVLPAEAQMLLFAEDQGVIRLAVRAPDDSTPLPTAEVVFSDLLTVGSTDVPLNQDNSLAVVVPEGFRAIALSVDKVIGAGGLIRPGDRVDVLAVMEAEVRLFSGQDAGDQLLRAVTLEQNVEVLSVEQALENPEAPAVATEDGEEPTQPAAQPSATVVTLAVSPLTAQALFLAEEGGTIRLAVRNPNDDTINSLPDTAFFFVQDSIGTVQIIGSDDLVELN